MSNNSIWPIDRTLSGTTTLGPDWTWEQWQWMSTLHSPNLTIRLFSVITRTFMRRVLLLCRDAVEVFCSSNWLDQGVMAMKGYSTFPKAPGLKHHYQMILCHIKNTSWRWLTPLQRCSHHILQPHLFQITTATNNNLKEELLL